MNATLDTYWPVLSVEHDTILSRQGDITVGFALELPELFSLSSRDYEALHAAWVKALRVLPHHTVVHKQDWFIVEQYRADFSGAEKGFLSRASERFFNERPGLRHTAHLFVTKKPEGRRGATSLLSTLVRPHLAPPQTLSSLHLQEFTDSVGQMERILNDSGYLALRRLRSEELLSSPARAGVLESYCLLQEPGSTPQLQDLAFEDGMRIGDKHLLLYTLADAEDLPPLCGPRISYERYSTGKSPFPIGFAAPLGGLLFCSHLFNQYILIEEPAATLKRLEQRRLRLQSLSAYSRENAISRDATSEFLNEALAEGRLPVKAHFNVMAWSSDPGELKALRSLLSGAIAAVDAVPRQETVGAPQIFWAGVPGGEGSFPLNETFDTFLEQACCFLNAETSARSSRSPVGLRLGERLTGAPVHVDLSDEPMQRGIITNRNKFILGPSGSGKSFFTNHLVRSYYEQGSHIVVVDVGHSYRGLCELVGGYYFTYSEQHPIRFNPFFTGAEGAPDTEKKESIKTLLLALWKKEGDSLNRSEYVALSAALQQYYEFLAQHEGVFPCFDTFYEFLDRQFASVLKADRVKERDFDMDNFLYVLRPYYRGGELDYLLNARENLDLLHHPFIVFELDNIKDHPILLPVVTIIIMEVFISKMRRLSGVRKMILIEEAWKAIAREGMAEYIRYLFKTVRKFYGEAVVVTQDLEDIISSPVVKQAIVGNSDCTILLDQSRYQNKFEAIEQLLGLTEKEKALVLSLNRSNEPGRRYKEVFISLGSTLSRVYRTEVSPEEYLTYTTEETEKLKVAQYARRWGSRQKGTYALARELGGDRTT